uniref:Uncharacterized protein n=1 Tax=Biomphalaria glabrata TaxID=6526 RepID=A0A2C9M4V7_BIOGL
MDHLFGDNAGKKASYNIFITTIRSYEVQNYQQPQSSLLEAAKTVSCSNVQVFQHTVSKGHQKSLPSFSSEHLWFRLFQALDFIKIAKFSRRIANYNVRHCGEP